MGLQINKQGRQGRTMRIGRPWLLRQKKRDSYGKKENMEKYKKSISIIYNGSAGFLYLLINNYVPMTGIIIAFKHLNFAKGILHSDWAGLSNFKYLFKTPDAALITRNTLLYNFAFIVVNTTVLF